MLIEKFPLAAKVVAGVTAAVFLLGTTAIVAGIACKVLAAAIGVIGAVLTAVLSPIGLVVAALVGGVATAVVVARQLSPAFRKEMDGIMAALAELDFSRAWQLLTINLSIALTQATKAAHDFFAFLTNTAAATGAYLADSLIEGLDRLMGVFGSDILALQAGFEKLGLYFRAAFDWKFAVSGLRAALAEVDTELERQRARGGDADSRSAERTASRQAAADERQAADNARNEFYDATIEGLRAQLEAARAPKKKPADEKTSAKRSDRREPGFDGPQAPAAAAFGAVLSTFSAGIAEQIGIGPQIDAVQQTADNTKRAADGIDDLINMVDFGKGGIQTIDPAGMQQAIAAIGDATATPLASDDKSMLSAAEQTAMASERQVQLLEQIARSVRDGGVAFA
jgi:hypothetical protein